MSSKKSVKKRQISVNLLPSVHEYLLREELDHGSKSQVVAAALAALRCASKADRERFFVWGNLLSEDDAYWAELIRMANQKTKDRAAAMDKLVDMVLKRRAERGK